MAPKIVRPDLSETVRDKLNAYLTIQWQRAVDGRTTQIDGDYSRWDKNYRGTPAERIRTVPWYKSSNVVVKLIRMFLDTFVDRTLNIIFSTRPLYTCESFPRERREALEYYINRKALDQWKHYELTREMLRRGNKTGTAVCKVVWEELEEISVTQEEDGSISRRPVKIFSGPKATAIPFEDVYIYPVEVNYWEDAEIIFHRLRYTEEAAKRKIRNSLWELTEEDLEGHLKEPNDVKKEEARQDAGITNSGFRELQVIECHLKFNIEDDDNEYRIVALFQPDLARVIDVYFFPYSYGLKMFYDYRPFPQEDLAFGESMAGVLEQAQEEASQIHNDRRNVSFLAAAPVFKRKRGSLLPNPSTDWYPGKVWDLDEMDDLDVVSIGGRYNDMITEETHVMQMAERLIGIGPAQQGYSQGMMGKRGIYNASGTLALLSEGNQRQDTAIRDIRVVMSNIARCCFTLQLLYGRDDPFIATLPDKMEASVREAMQGVDPEIASQSRFEIKTGDASKNEEALKASLFQLLTMIGQYVQACQQMVGQLVQPGLNPALRMVMNDSIKLYQWIITRLLRAFKEYDVEEILPDVIAAVATVVPDSATTSTGTAPPSDLPSMVNGGAQGAPGMAQATGLEALLKMGGQGGGTPGEGGVGY